MARKGKKTTAAEDFIWVDPVRVRFQHARIRPVFSGCGRSVVGTLESIRRKELAPDDLPPIQVSSSRKEHIRLFLRLT